MSDPTLSNSVILRSRKSNQPAFLQWLPWEKLTIWALFLMIVYALRHFFLIIFLTFIVSYMMRSVVERLCGWITPTGPRPWLERLLAVACFALFLWGLYGTGKYFGPKLIEQGQALLGRLTRLNPEREFATLLSKTVGAYLFRRDYGDPSDARYKKELMAFLDEGPYRVEAYQEFPGIEAGIEGTFENVVEEEQRQRLLAERGRSPMPGKAFDEWFLTRRAPALIQENKDLMIVQWEERFTKLNGPNALAELRKDAKYAAIRDERMRQDLLDQVKAEPERFAKVIAEWTTHELSERVAQVRATAEYQQRFREYYQRRRATNPAGMPYEYERYVQLKRAHREGTEAFTKALSETDNLTEEERLAQVERDFKLKRQDEMARAWWAEDPTALFLRSAVEKSFTEGGGAAASWLRNAVGYAFTIPIQVALSLLLSFFITFDIPKLKKGIAKLHHSRISGLYEEIAPGLISFSRLMGRAFQAQAVIALCNTSLTFGAIALLNIQNEVFLCAIVFICSFIPVVGVVLSSVPIAVIALVQPGGSVWLAIMAVVAILVIHFIETSILNPKILGDMLHLHPVLVLAVLAVGEHFFGVWGLLLAVPVTVYVIRFVILDEGIPGFIEPIRSMDSLTMSAQPSSIVTSSAAAAAS